MVIDHIAKHMPADGSYGLQIIENITTLSMVEKKIEFTLLLVY